MRRWHAPVCGAEHSGTGHAVLLPHHRAHDGTRLFAAPSAAALAMRYFCRITGRKDIFSVCKRVLRELPQKGRSDRAAEKQILHDKQLSEMVDTTSISMSISAGGFADQQTESAGGSSDFTGVDELELVVLAQELLDAVAMSAALVPTDIGEVLTHVLQKTSEDQSVRASATLMFGEFVARAVANPVDYGLLEQQPRLAVQRALDRAGVVLSLVSVGHMFTSKDGALAQFNAVSNDNQKRIEDFFYQLTDDTKQRSPQDDSMASGTPDANRHDCMCVHVCARQQEQV